MVQRIKSVAQGIKPVKGHGILRGKSRTSYTSTAALAIVTVARLAGRA
jgi:hypothetical protein